MLNIVNRDGTIKSRAFKDLSRGGDEYRIIATANSFTGARFWDDSAFKSVDTLKRMKDGAVKSYTREGLEKRFTNVELIQLGEWE